MKKFEVLPKEAGAARIKAQASTRAGLMTSALQGMFVAAGAKVDEDSDEKIERPFSVMADDAAGLLAEFLTAALASGIKHGEAFDDVRFTLVTDKKAEGAFVGKACKKYDMPIEAVERDGLAMEKDAEGEWVSEIRFRS